jgi:hypothetical protein
MHSPRPAPQSPALPKPVDRKDAEPDRAAVQRAERRPALVMVLTPFLGLLIWAGLALLAV